MDRVDAAVHVGAAAGRRLGAGDRLVVIARTLLALLGFSALVTEIATLVAAGHFVPGNFFSFFTVESNALAVLSLLLSSFATAAGRSPERLRLFRGAVTLYMTTTLLVFIVLLSGLPAAQLTAVPWDNTVLHYIMPVVIILDWLLLDRGEAIAVRQALLWLVFPLLYLVYSLVRGAIVGWYPYPFLNAAEHGYLRVVGTSVVIAAVLVALTALIAGAARWTPRATVRA